MKVAPVSEIDPEIYDFSGLDFYTRYRRHPGFTREEIRSINYADLSSALESDQGFALADGNEVIALASSSLLEWESHHFGLPMGRLACFSSSRCSPEMLSEVINRSLQLLDFRFGCKHISVEVDIDDYCSTNGLIRLNFEMMDVRRIYCVNSMRTDASYTRFLSSVRSYRDEDYLDVVPIFNALDFNTRFTRDCSLDQDKVRSMYRIWFEKLLAENGGKANTVVFERQGRIVGCGGVGETDLKCYGINRRIRSGALYGCLSEGTGGYNAVLYKFTSDALKSHGAIEASVSLNSPVTARAIEGIRPNKSVTRFCMRLYRG